MIASLILLLHYAGGLSLESAIACLYLTGVLLFVAEVLIVSMGILSLNGLLALYAGFALQTGQIMFLDHQIGIGVVFAISFVELCIVVIGFYLWKRYKNKVPSAGTDAMIGQKAVVLEWENDNGKISYEGETWKAKSDRPMDLRAQEKVTIDRIEKLTLIVRA